MIDPSYINGVFGLASIALTAWLGKRVSQVKHDTARALDQLENDHQDDPNLTGNLREDMDKKQQQTLRIVQSNHKEVLREVKDMREEDREQREEIRLLRAAQRTTDNRLGNIEDSMLRQSNKTDREREINGEDSRER